MLNLLNTSWYVLPDVTSYEKYNRKYRIRIIPTAHQFIFHKIKTINDNIFNERLLSSGYQTDILSSIECLEIRNEFVVSNQESITNCISLFNGLINQCVTALTEFFERNNLISSTFCQKEQIFYVIQSHLKRCVNYNISDIDLYERDGIKPQIHIIIDNIIEENSQVEEARRDMQEEFRGRRMREIQRQQDEYDKNKAEARNISIELLKSMLTSSQEQEFDKYHRVSVETDIGKFVVFCKNHEMVERYQDNKLVSRHCVIFKDWRIPAGDEMLMKIALLQTDPNLFLKKCNTFTVR